MKEYKKICIIGGSGTGKTTLASNLSKDLNIPVTHIDGINYLPNWVERDKEERDKIILNKIKNDSWIIDGTYRSTLRKRIEVADLVIYLDYSTFTQLRGIFKRYLTRSKIEKKEIPGCKEKIDWQFLKFVINWRKNKRKEILNIINNSKINKIIIFKNRKELNKWYLKNLNKKLIV